MCLGLEMSHAQSNPIPIEAAKGNRRGLFSQIHATNTIVIIQAVFSFLFSHSPNIHNRPGTG